MALISVSNNALQNITAVPASIPTGALVLLSTQTASSSASLSFTSGIDSTYSSYVFKFINCHPATDDVSFQFQGSTDGGSNYGVTITSTNFDAQHNEDDANTFFQYNTAHDLAQSTSFQTLLTRLGNGNDENAVGTLQLFNPSSTVFVKHFINRASNYHTSDRANDVFTAGYFNDGANAINAIQFKFSSGNIDDGIIKMYGVK